MSSSARREFFRLTLLASGLMASGVVLAAAVVDPQLTQQMRKARPTQALQVIVTFKQSGPASVQQIAALKTLGIKQGVTMQRLPIMGVMATPAQVRQIAKRADVASVYYNARLRYHNLEARQLSSAARVSTTTTDFGRAIPYSGRGVTVVVNDSGLDTTHPDLPMGTKVQDNVLAPQNILANTTGIVPYTAVKGMVNTDLGSGHGQHCAGTVAGTGAASGGRFRGAAPGADLVGYGSGGVLLILDAVGGLDFALTNQFAYRNPIRVVTNSWGSSGKFDPVNPVNISSYELFKAGIVSVFAAGNDGPGEDTHNPYAQAPWVISVGASEKDGVLTSFSSRGNRGEVGNFETPDGRTWTYRNEPTVVAAGVDIVSTRTATGALFALSAPQDAGLGAAHAAYYSHLSGTSMATPHVAGVVALLLEANPRLTPSDVKRILQTTATNMTGRRTFEVGAGHLNAHAAVAMAAGINRAYGTTTKQTLARSFRTGEQPGREQVLLAPQNAISAPVAAQPEHKFQVPKGLVQLIGKVDNLSAPNGLGNSIVVAELVDPTGKVYTGTGSLPGAILLGGNVSTATVTAEAGSTILDGEWTLRFTGEFGTPVFTPEEIQMSATGRMSGGRADPSNIAQISDPAIKSALETELVDVEANGAFTADLPVTRGMLARYLTIAGNIRQSLPLKGGATTVGGMVSTDPLFPFVAAVTARGGVLRDLTYTQAPVMPLKPGQAFEPGRTATRLELAYALVQALGDEAQTQQIALPASGNMMTADGKEIADTAEIPEALRRHVKRAVDLGILSLMPLGNQMVFAPKGGITKGVYAAAAAKYRDVYRSAED